MISKLISMSWTKNLTLLSSNKLRINPNPKSMLPLPPRNSLRLLPRRHTNLYKAQRTTSRATRRICIQIKDAISDSCH